MKKQRFVAIAGLWIALLGYLGFPMALKNILYLLTGIALLIVGYMLYREKKMLLNKGEAKPKPFMESRPEIRDYNMPQPERRRRPQRIARHEPIREPELVQSVESSHEEYGQ
jgi:hypothetical protein